MLLQPTIVVERPPEGPARGKWEGAPWMIIALVVIAVLGAAAYWLVRLRKARDPET
jgi:ABC-type transporter Mla subunit MlaD